jgi:hypothetical protein
LDKSPGDSLLFKQSALRGVSYALTIERAGGAAALLTGIGPRIEPTQPFPLRLGTRIAGGAGDGADMDVAILD